MLLAVAAFAAATAHAAEIRVATQGAHSVAVVGVTPAERATPLRVYTGDPPAADQPEIAGRVEATAEGLVFHPLFPFVAGLRYTAVFGATSRVFEVAAPGGPAPRVTALFPSGDTLPENALRLYVHFSQPMEVRDVQRHVHLLDEAGRDVELPFVEIEHGLWDPDRTRLTLLFHPGRVKRGVAPGEALGPPLVAGQGYRLVVDADVRDAAGRRLGQAFEHAFHATRADRTSPEARSFVVHPPAEPRAALEVELPEALDEALLRRWLWVEDASGAHVRGRIAISAGETRWSFTPEAPWRTRPYALRVNPALEDRAGNRFDRLFDREITAASAAAQATTAPLSLSFALGAAATNRARSRAIVAYVFPQERTIDPAEIAAERLTHVNYAFANIREGRVVEGFAKDAENLKALTSLRARNPALAILVSVGGWTWSGGFSDAVLTAPSRAAFVASAVDYVRRHDLDGFDVDWEYPGLVGFGNVHRPEDKENFTALMAELRAALDSLGRETKRRYLLTMAAGASDEFLEHTEMAKVQAALDLVNLMTYDFREAGSDPVAGHHANLFANPRDPERRSADGAVRAFLAAGVPPAKLVLGVPFYGKAWGGVSPENDGLYEPGGPLETRLPTHYGDLAATSVDAGGFVRRWDDAAQAPYLWNAAKRIFITYEDPESLAIKGRYIRDQGLAGAMFWEYYADPGGTLLSTLDRELRPR